MVELQSPGVRGQDRFCGRRGEGSGEWRVASDEWRAGRKSRFLRPEGLSYSVGLTTWGHFGELGRCGFR